MDKTAFIDKVVNRIINGRDSDWAMNVDNWDWGPGVGMYGVTRAFQRTGNKAYGDFIKQWVDRHVEKAYKVKTVNSTAPLLTVLSLYMKTGGKEYLKVCTDIADWILNYAPKTIEGGFEHTVTEGAKFSQQIWADTLFMACIFLSRLGNVTKNPAYSDQAARQLLIHHRILKDKESGLFYHGWNCEARNWMSGALWARANAWITVSTVEMLEQLPQEFEGRQEIINSLLEQVEALSHVQRADGMFGTLLNHSDAYSETSASAGFAYGIKRGIKDGFIPAEYETICKKAEEAVIRKINDRGEVEGVSGGTPVMKTQEDYKRIPTLPTLYGQGLALLMLCE